MRMSDRGKHILVKLEGMETQAYADSGGALTIGVGHLLTRSERASGKLVIGSAEVPYRIGLTREQALELFTQDLLPVEEAVTEDVTVPLEQCEFDALCSFAFNVGIGAFERSTLLYMLNLGAKDKVPSQLQRWVWADGKIVPGLQNRRQEEIALWLGT